MSLRWQFPFPWPVVLLLALASPSQCRINLFISKYEMNRTLGLSAELTYVENGVINTYATRFPYRVNVNITQVTFSWNTKVYDRKVAYTVRAVADDVAVLPVIMIPHRGFLPIVTENFTIEYRCAGNKAGQFDVSLYLNFSWPSETNHTVVTLRQEKLCALREWRVNPGGPDDEYDQNGLRMDPTYGLVTGENVFYMVIGCVGAVVLVIAVLLAVYFKSTRKSLTATSSSLPPVPEHRYTSINRTPDFSAHVRPLIANDVTAPALPKTNPCRASCSTPRQPVVYDRAPPVDVTVALVDLYADRNLFQVLPIHELEGTFGELKWAIWKPTTCGECGDVDDEEDHAEMEQAVLIKSLKTNADRRHLTVFLQQALAFHHVPPFDHLAQPAAAASFGRFECPDTVSDFPLICYRHHGFGNLKKFLQRCRGALPSEANKNGGSSSAQTLRAHELVSMGIQILRAILHLHKYGIIHKDVATRNCLVSELGVGSERLHVQLCDAALSRDLFANEYHCLGDNENRPVKWMAFECLKSNVYSSATDAWSFGVTLWELLSCGQQPYADIDPEEMATILEQGHRLVQPYNCPDELYDVMFCCWYLDYRDRPSCEQLLLALQDFTVQLRQFI